MGPLARMGIVTAVAALVAVLGFLIWQPQTNESAVDGDDEVLGLALAGPGGGIDELGAEASSLEWSSGLASSLECNLLTGSDFTDRVVPDDYFADATTAESIAATGGFGNSAALVLDATDGAAMFSEVVPIAAGSSYWFRGWFSAANDPTGAEMGIALLDADYVPIGAATASPISPASGFAESRIDGAPSAAAYALPYVANAGSGAIVSDELVFGETNSCFAELTELAG